MLALFLLGFLLPVYLSTDWLGQRAAVTRSPIGHLVALHAHGGWGSRLVIETETGFFPVHGDVAGAKGVALFLESRRWGPDFICDESRTTCVEALGETFMPSPIPSTPAAK